MIHVLIADDKEENLYYLHALLTAHGCTVESVHNGAEALEKARLTPPAIIVSDLLMPVMDGYTLLRCWKADPQLNSAPFIVYTATYTEPEDERLALSLGADAFIQKPADPEAFMAQFNAVLARASAMVPRLLNHPEGDETAQLKRYSEALVRKLEKRTLQLEAYNRSLQQDLLRWEKSENEIRRSTNLLRAVADGIPDAVFVKDLKGRYLLFNQGAAQLVGRRVEEVLGQDDTLLFGLEDAQFVMERDREVMESNQARTAEEVLTAAGATRTYLATKVPYRDGTGKVIGIIGISRDITERKLAEKKLAEQAELLDKAQDAILVRGLEHQILYWNRSAERLYGWTAAEVAGRSVKDLLYGVATPFLEATNATLTKGEWMGELEQLTKEGKTVIVEGRWTLMRDEHGTPKSILAINTDITERKKLEQQFLRAQRLESIGTLAGGIAHDLNNVLAPIMMSIDLLKLQEKDANRLSILSTIEGSAKRGADMVGQVLTFARGVEGQRMNVHIGHLLKEIENIANDTFLKNIEVRSDIPPDLWPVQGDTTQLHQILLNLCVNARDAMPNGGTLSISGSNLLVDEHYAGLNAEVSVGPHVILQVEDTGTGMSPEVADRIFEPFFTTKELGKGTGLGLSTTLAIVKSHGGFIRVYSEIGRGTTFRVCLPAQPVVGPATTQQPENDLLRGNNEMILVVDDEASVRQITRQTLEAFGYRVLLAADGAEAVAIYAQHKHEISGVLTDMMMPVMDGPATIQVLMHMNPHVRIIGASGLNANGMVAKAVNAGVKHFLPKPYTAVTLLKTLSLMLAEQTISAAARREP